MEAHRSPYAEEESSRSTCFSYALLELSDRKSACSARVGGSPVRSTETRRRSSDLSASDEGERDSSSSLARMKRSIGWRTQSRRFTAGSDWGLGGTKAQ